MSPKEEKFDPQVLATTMMGGVKSIFEKMSTLTFSQDPEFKEREIIEYDSRWRVFGLEKFNSACYVAVINFYRSTADQELHKACGAFVLYIEEGNAAKLLKALGYPDVDDEDLSIMFDIVGELCNVLAGQFKNDLLGLGFPDLVMSAPQKYRNDVPDGVEFEYEQTTYYELSFFLWKEKVFVIDATLGSL
ncbi:MAG: hypothetical protein KC733_00480 [Candidatus Omnitrophica bacterium]|nr:hypothetical protein [Candidatus Omnitrophota bacterium]